MTVSPTANRAAAGRAGWVLVVAARVGVVVPARRGRHTFRLHSELFCRAKRLVGWSVGRLLGCDSRWLVRTHSPRSPTDQIISYSFCALIEAFHALAIRSGWFVQSHNLVECSPAQTAQPVV